MIHSSGMNYCLVVLFSLYNVPTSTDGFLHKNSVGELVNLLRSPSEIEFLCPQLVLNLHHYSLVKYMPLKPELVV